MGNESFGVVVMGHLTNRVKILVHVYHDLNYFLMGHHQPLFRFFRAFSNINTIVTGNKCEKLST